MQKNSSLSYQETKGVFEKKLPFLIKRNTIIRAIKKFFDNNDFIEVDTPILQYSPGMEVHLHAFETKFNDISGNESKQLYLHTSPEFAMKKLLSFGLPKIYQFTHVFRNEVVSPTHYPEFTMLEWYHLDQDYKKLMQDVEEILKIVATTANIEHFSHNDKLCNPFNGVEILTIQNAFLKFCNFDILKTVDNYDIPTPELLKSHATTLGINVSTIDTWDDIFAKIMFELIEPNLGINKPTILCEYPIHQAALSKPKNDNPNIAERFEVYVCGIELGNAFSELTNAKTQRLRFENDMQAKKELYNRSYPIDEDLIEAVAHLKPCTGIAVGIDRLIMLATQAKTINEILWSEIPTL